MISDPKFFLMLGVAYLLGCVPTGLWLGQCIRRVDIREHGSKNIGATNTLRVLGVKLGVVALVADVGKGLAVVLLVEWLSLWAHAPLACGVAAILGHSFSLFLRFRGGKGVATTAGVFAGLAPYPTLIAVVVFLVVLALTRMVSAGSICAAVALGVSIFVFPQSLAVRIATLVVTTLIVVKHRSNIKRILQGTESRIGKRGSGK